MFHTYRYTLIPTFPPFFKAQQHKGSDLKCHSQVVISCPVNMCQMIASFPQAEGWMDGWMENTRFLLANKLWDLVSFSPQAPNLLLCSFSELFTAFLQSCWGCVFRLRTLALLGRAQIYLGGARTKPSRTYQRKCHLNGEHLFFSGLDLYLWRKWELVGEGKGFLADKGMSFGMRYQHILII